MPGQRSLKSPQKPETCGNRDRIPGPGRLDYGNLLVTAQNAQKVRFTRELMSLPAADVARASGLLGNQLEDIKRASIVKAVEQTRYNKTAAAKPLGMTFRALRYRIKKLGIE